jgi:hypothetical protein
VKSVVPFGCSSFNLPVGKGVGVDVWVGVGLGVKLGVKVTVAVGVAVANGFGMSAIPAQESTTSARIAIRMEKL